MDIVEDLVTSTFTELPEDEHPIFRENACWALDYLAAREREQRCGNALVRTRTSTAGCARRGRLAEWVGSSCKVFVCGSAKPAGPV